MTVKELLAEVAKPTERLVEETLRMRFGDADLRCGKASCTARRKEGVDAEGRAMVYVVTQELPEVCLGCGRLKELMAGAGIRNRFGVTVAYGHDGQRSVNQVGQQFTRRSQASDRLLAVGLGLLVGACVHGQLQGIEAVGGQDVAQRQQGAVDPGAVLGEDGGVGSRRGIGGVLPQDCLGVGQGGAERRGGSAEAVGGGVGGIGPALPAPAALVEKESGARAHREAEEVPDDLTKVKGIDHRLVLMLMFTVLGAVTGSWLHSLYRGPDRRSRRESPR